MDIDVWDIEFYEKNGKCPVLYYLEEVKKRNKVEYNCILDKIYLLKRLGIAAKFSGEKFSKHLRNGIFELKYKKHRILYCFEGYKIILLLSGFRKETRKTPPSEIEKAEKEKEEYERR